MFRNISSTWTDPFHPRHNIPKSFGATVFGSHLQEVERAKSFPVNRYRTSKSQTAEKTRQKRGGLKASLQSLPSNSPDQQTAIHQLHSQLQMEKAVLSTQKRTQIEGQIAAIKHRLQG